MKQDKPLTNKEKCQYILRKEPRTKFNRAKFFWRYIMIFVLEYEMPSITFSQFESFWKNFAGMERSLRDVLKEPEFKLPPSNDSKRYEKSSLFRENAKR